MAEFSDLLGKTLKEIKYNSNYDDQITFITEDGKEYIMKHYQDCCESVSIESIDGDIQRLIGSPIMTAEKVTKDDNTEDENGYKDAAAMWTFYKLGTIIDTVTIRWYGTSNGYYSVSVDFYEAGAGRWE